ncbi:MAG: hypothetical protein RIQ93_604 [Verrucomicrobiota bacterium]|jgi:hypothetical protein
MRPKSFHGPDDRPHVPRVKLGPISGGPDVIEKSLSPAAETCRLMGRGMSHVFFRISHVADWGGWNYA